MSQEFVTTITNTTYPVINGYGDSHTWGRTYAVFLPKNPRWETRPEKNVLQTPQIKGSQSNKYIYHFHLYTADDGETYFDYDNKHIDAPDSFYRVLMDTAVNQKEFSNEHIAQFTQAGMIGADGLVNLKIPNCLVEIVPDDFIPSPGLVSYAEIDEMNFDELHNFSKDILSQINKNELEKNPDKKTFRALALREGDDAIDQLRAFIKAHKHVIGAGKIRNTSNGPFVFLQDVKPVNGNFDKLIALKSVDGITYVINIRRKLSQRNCDLLATMSRRTMELLRSDKLTSRVIAGKALLTWLEKEGFIDMINGMRPPEEMMQITDSQLSPTPVDKLLQAISQEVEEQKPITVGGSGVKIRTIGSGKPSPFV